MSEDDLSANHFASALLYPSGGPRASVNPATSHAIIESDDLEYWLADIVDLRRRIPTELLGTVLHEWAHHHSLSTVLGASLAVLAADIRCRLEHGQYDRKTAFLQKRFQFVIALMRPILEGLAVFSE